MNNTYFITIVNLRLARRSVVGSVVYQGPAFTLEPGQPLPDLSGSNLLLMESGSQERVYVLNRPLAIGEAVLASNVEIR